MKTLSPIRRKRDEMREAKGEDGEREIFWPCVYGWAGFNCSPAESLAGTAGTPPHYGLLMHNCGA